MPNENNTLYTTQAGDEVFPLLIQWGLDGSMEGLLELGSWNQYNIDNPIQTEWTMTGGNISLPLIFPPNQTIQIVQDGGVLGDESVTLVGTQVDDMTGADVMEVLRGAIMDINGEKVGKIAGNPGESFNGYGLEAIEWVLSQGGTIDPDYLIKYPSSYSKEARDYTGNSNAITGIILNPTQVAEINNNTTGIKRTTSGVILSESGSTENRVLGISTIRRKYDPISFERLGIRFTELSIDEEESYDPITVLENKIRDLEDQLASMPPAPGDEGAELPTLPEGTLFKSPEGSSVYIWHAGQPRLIPGQRWRWAAGSGTHSTSDPNSEIIYVRSTDSGNGNWEVPGIAVSHIPNHNQEVYYVSYGNSVIVESAKSALENWPTLTEQATEGGTAAPTLFTIIMNAYNASVQTLPPEEFDKVMYNVGGAVYNYNPAAGTVRIEARE